MSSSRSSPNTDATGEPSDQERSEALQWAAHVRNVRATTLEALESGDLSLRRCFADTDSPAVAEIHILDLLEALEPVRKVDARRALAAAGVAGDASLGATSASDRTKVLEIADRLCG